MDGSQSYCLDGCVYSLTHSPILKAGELKDEMREDDGVIAERLAAQHDAPTCAEIPPRSTAGVFICAPEMAARSQRDSRHETPTPIRHRFAALKNLRAVLSDRSVIAYSGIEMLPGKSGGSPAPDATVGSSTMGLIIDASKGVRR